ncbi:hypothetical protein PF004_g30208 [Phytophthora fragariae]|nr:hypothetical protein PF004_g30208 [Phytophthora fragariae]
MPNNQGQAQPQGTDQTPPEPAPPGQSAPGISFEFGGPSPASSAGFAAAQSSGQAPATTDTLAQMLQVMMQMSQQQTAFMGQVMAQTAHIQQLILQTRPRNPHKRGDPPPFKGKDNEDLELFLFSTEQYYADFMSAMHEDSSEFTDMIFGSLGVDAQSWFREFKLSMDSRPITWQLFKERIRARFRDKDHKFKTLTKLYELKPGKSQQEYTSSFLNLLSQLDTELPEIVKRWFYQQPLRAETSAYISQNIPQTLEHAIELAQRFKDAKPSAVKNPAKEHPKQQQQGSTANKSQTGNRTSESNKFCDYCKRRNHTESECRTKARAEAKAGDSPKNGKAR